MKQGRAWWAREDVHEADCTMELDEMNWRLLLKLFSEDDWVVNEAGGGTAEPNRQACARERSRLI